MALPIPNGRRLALTELVQAGLALDVVRPAPSVDKGKLVGVLDRPVGRELNRVGDPDEAFGELDALQGLLGQQGRLCVAPEGPPPIETPPPIGGATVAANSSTDASPPQATRNSEAVRATAPATWNN